MFTYSNGYWEVYGHFQGDFLVDGRVMQGELSIEEFVMGGENFHEGGAGLFSIF